MLRAIDRAFTLLEVIIVLAIVAVLAALAYPFLGTARTKATSATTDANLRQLWLALELYRQDHDGGGSGVGSSSALGLPNREGFFGVMARSKVVWWRSKGKSGAYGPIYYPLDKSDITPENRAQMTVWYDRWMATNARNEGHSVIVGDFNHTVGCGAFPHDDCLFIGQGIALDGALAKKSATGNIALADWWEQ